MDIGTSRDFCKRYKGNTRTKVEVYTGETPEEKDIVEIEDVKLHTGLSLGETLDKLYDQIAKLKELLKEVMVENEELKLMNQQILGIRGEKE